MPTLEASSGWAFKSGNEEGWATRSAPYVRFLRYPAPSQTCCACRSGHFSQRRDISLVIVRLSELRQRLGSSENRQNRTSPPMLAA
jgi:hypothetical protein